MSRQSVPGIAAFATLRALLVLLPVGLLADQESLEQFVGKTLSVQGSVIEVHGPRFFELHQHPLDQPEGDLLVFLPEGTVAAVRQNDRVTVTGTVRRLPWADVIRPAPWLDVSDVRDGSLRLARVLVATRIVGDDIDREIMVRDKDTTALSSAAFSPISSIPSISAGDLALVGRRVVLPPVMIHSIDRAYGFCVNSGSHNFFVMVQRQDIKRLRVGDAVALNGVILALPPTLAAGLRIPAHTNTTIYVYADPLKSGR